MVPSPATAGAGPGLGRPLEKHFPAAQTSLCHPRGRAAQNGAMNPDHHPPTPHPRLHDFQHTKSHFVHLAARPLASNSFFFLHIMPRSEVSLRCPGGLGRGWTAASASALRFLGGLRSRADPGAAWLQGRTERGRSVPHGSGRGGPQPGPLGAPREGRAGRRLWLTQTEIARRPQRSVFSKTCFS